MKETPLILDSKDFFRERVTQALGQCRIETAPMVSDYLVDLLRFYVNTDNLYEEQSADGKKDSEDFG